MHEIIVQPEKNENAVAELQNIYPPYLKEEKKKKKRLPFILNTVRLSSFSGSNSHASASFGFYEHIARKEIADIKMVELCCSPLGYKVVGKDRLFLFLTAGNLKKEKFVV